MTARALRRLAAAVLLLAVPAAAQTGPATTVRGGIVAEGFTFDGDLGFDALTEISAPVLVETALGSRAVLTVASGWARVDLDLADGTTRSLSGLLDTEARVSVTLLRDRLQLLLSGSVPTGMGAVSEADAALLGPLSYDLLDFATPTLGTGAVVGAGLAGAAPAGGASVGWAAHVRVPLSYQPLLGSDDEVRAGVEVRGRLGLETPVGRRSFFRVAGVLSIRGKDHFDDAVVNGVGNRLAGYASFDTPLGGSLATVWLSGLYRSDPTLEPTAVGSSFVPRGGLLAAGARLTMNVGMSRLEPEVEFRTASAAPDAAGLDLETLGRVVRMGLRLHRPVGTGMGLVLYGGGVVGTVQDGLRTADTRGYRASLFLEWTR